MNDDPPSSYAHTPHHAILEVDTPDAITETEAGTSIEDERHLKLRLQKAKRATFLDDLIRNLDIAIYCELSVLYYMDCSLFRFFLRALPQWFYFTPKPVFFPVPPRNRPYIAAILLPNFFNILLHIYSTAPAAGEAMRGYIHGALLIDFVGELGPISKTRLVLLDLLTLVLQFVILAVVLEREALKKGMVGSLGATATTTQDEAGLAGQDHDAEEQGRHRSDLAQPQDIELQPLHPLASDVRYDQTSSETDALFGSSSSLVPRASRREHPLDTFHTGQHVIANLHVIEAIRTSYRRYQQGGLGTDATPSQPLHTPRASIRGPRGAGRRGRSRSRGTSRSARTL